MTDNDNEKLVAPDSATEPAPALEAEAPLNEQPAEVSPSVEAPLAEEAPPTDGQEPPQAEQNAQPKMRKPRPKYELTAVLTQLLEEDHQHPRGQINKIIHLLGTDYAQLMADAAVEIYNAEGIMLHDGSRKRTLGGTFFYLVRTTADEHVSASIFGPMYSKKIRNYHPMPWDKRVEPIKMMRSYNRKGGVREVNITIKGRPNAIKRQDSAYIVLVDMVNKDYEQIFPRGIPEIPDFPEKTQYVLYVGEPQWQKHVGDIFFKDKDAIIYAEGLPILDSETNTIAVFVRNVKTFKGSEARQMEREKQRRKAGLEHNKAQKKALEQKKEEALAEQAAQVVPPALSADGVPDISAYAPDVQAKLRSLYGARRLFLKRLADIEALPADKQSGLQAARLMVERTDKQITDLLEQPPQTPE